MSNLILRVVTYAEAATAIKTIRHSVFQVEQGVDSALDFDGLDEVAMHIVVYQDDQPVGTARIRYLTEQLAKIERVAVLATYRGQGIGRKIMVRAIAFLDNQNCVSIKLNSQVQVKEFYQKLGFEQSGEEFYEAGILHIAMQRIHRDLQKS